MLKDKYYFLLILILSLSLFLNMFGINWGLPAHWYPDEYETIEKTVIPMARNFDFNPHYFMKPSLYYYLLEMFLSPYFIYLKVVNVPIVSYENFIGTVTLIARVITALIGVVGVFLMYLLGKNVGGQKAGLISSLLLAISLGYVSYSHLAYYDVPMLVLVFSSLLLYFKYLDRWQISFLYWASFISGLAISTKYNSLLLVGITFLLCHFFRIFYEAGEKRSVRKILQVSFSRRLFLSIGLLAVGFLIATPFSVLDFRTFISDFIKQLFTTRSYKVFAATYSWWDNISILKNSFGFPMFIFLLLLFGYGFVEFVKKPNKKEAIIFFVPLIYYGYVGSWRIAAFRYIFPTVPFLILAGSLSLSKLCNGRKIKKIITSSVFGIVFIYSIIFTFKGVYCFTNDTRETATKWIEKNIKPESRVEVYSFMSYLPRFPNNLQLVKIRPDFITVSESYNRFKKTKLGRLLSKGEDTNRSDNRSKFSMEALAKRNPDYIVLSSFYYERYLDDDKKKERRLSYPVLTQYFEKLLNGDAGYEIIARFEKRGTGMEKFSLNPTILVLQKNL